MILPIYKDRGKYRLEKFCWISISTNIDEQKLWNISLKNNEQLNTTITSILRSPVQNNKNSYQNNVFDDDVLRKWTLKSVDICVAMYVIYHQFQNNAGIENVLCYISLVVHLYVDGFPCSIILYLIEVEWCTYASVTNHHWFRWWLVAWPVPSHYLNQCWDILNWTIVIKLQWNLNWNYLISFKKMHLKKSSAQWRQFCFNLNVITREVSVCVRGGVGWGGVGWGVGGGGWGEIYLYQWTPTRTWTHIGYNTTRFLTRHVDLGVHCWTTIMTPHRTFLSDLFENRISVN